jgi:urea transport system substrate-binding protein
MSITRRQILKGTAAAAAAGTVFAPNIMTGPAHAAWIDPSGTIKVGVLFSQTGNLSVVENDSTQVVLYAIDEINKAGGVAGMEVEPVVVDARSDIQVYS